MELETQVNLKGSSINNEVIQEIKIESVKQKSNSIRNTDDYHANMKLTPSEVFQIRNKRFSQNNC